MPPFTQYEPFFTAIAGASAGLAGLVFVALAVRFDIWSREEFFRSLGLLILTQFLFPFFLSLLILMPPHGWVIPTVIVALLGILVTWAVNRDAKKSRHLLQEEFVKRIWDGPINSSVPYAVLLLCVLMSIWGDPSKFFDPTVSWFTFIGYVLVVLLGAGLANAWVAFSRPPLASASDNSETQGQTSGRDSEKLDLSVDLKPPVETDGRKGEKRRKKSAQS